MTRTVILSVQVPDHLSDDNVTNAARWGLLGVCAQNEDVIVMVIDRLVPRPPSPSEGRVFCSSCGNGGPTATFSHAPGCQWQARYGR